jgi:proline iminopeptidase
LSVFIISVWLIQFNVCSTNRYSMDQSVQDLEALVKALDLQSFHLLGHSYGGVLAFEYMKQQQQRVLLAAQQQNQNHTSPTTTSYNHNPRSAIAVPKSLILSNTPTSFSQSSEEHARLSLKLQQGHVPDEDDSKEEEETRRLEQLFFETHECRTPRTPEPLARAIRKSHEAAWASAHQDIIHYHAAAAATSEHMHMPPTLLIRGEYDFVTESCTQSWFDILGRPPIWKETVLSNCAHYPHLEDGARYGTLLEDHCSNLEKVKDERPISQQGAMQVCA